MWFYLTILKGSFTKVDLCIHRMGKQFHKDFIMAFKFEISKEFCIQLWKKQQQKPSFFFKNFELYYIVTPGSPKVAGYIYS